MANPNHSLIAAALTAIGASVCCVVPLLLLSLGIGGAWIVNLTAMEPYSGYFAIAALLSLTIAFRQLYLIPPRSEPGAVCQQTQILKNRKIIFIIVSMIIIAMLSFPYYAGYFIG